METSVGVVAPLQLWYTTSSSPSPSQRVALTDDRQEKRQKNTKQGFHVFWGFPADLPEILKPKHPNRICVSSENRVYMANSIAYHHFPHFKEPELGAESPFSRFQAPQSFIILLAISHHIVDSEEESKLKRPRGFNRNKPNKIYPIQFILISYLPFKPSLAIINHY